MKIPKRQLGITPLVIVLIVAGVLVSVGGGYWFYPKILGISCKEGYKLSTGLDGPIRCTKISNSDLTTWHTYRNEEYGFEIKYPNNFRYLDNKKSNEALIVVWINEIADVPFNMNFFQITISPSIQYPSGISSPCLGAKSFGTIKIDNDTHEKYLLFSERANEFTTLCVNVVRGKYLFEFYAGTYSKDGLIIDKILSTFQFTK